MKYRLLADDRHAVARQPRGRGREVAKRNAPEAPGRLDEARGRPRHATRSGADVEDLLVLVGEGDRDRDQLG